MSAAAVCVMAIGLVAVPGALGVKSAKQVGGTVSVFVTPSSFTTGDTSVTTASVSGNVKSNSSCRKGRTVHLYWVTNGVQGPEVGTTFTRSNGDYSAIVPKPTDTNPPTTSVVLRATVDQVTRKVGSKKKGQKTKKGRRFDCLQLIGDSAPVTINPAPTI